GVGGFDPFLGPFLDGAELSRRVRLAGERVIVVPSARVGHSRASLWHGPQRLQEPPDGAHSFLARRVAVLYFRLLGANAWSLLLIALGMLLAAPVRALWRVAGNDLELAWQEIKAPLVVGANVRHLYR